MRVIYDSVTSDIVPENQFEADYLIEKLTVFVDTYDQGEVPVMYFRALDNGNIRVASGLIHHIHNLFEQARLPISYEDVREPHWSGPQYPEAQLKIIPYPDQAEIAKVMLREGRGVLHLAPNYGKTFLSAYWWWIANRPSMLFIVPTKVLLHQTSADLEESWGLPKGAVGRVGDGLRQWAPVTVAVVDSLTNWLDAHGNRFPAKFSAVIADEAHMGVGPEYQRVMSAVPEAGLRFGMSGTPYKKGKVDHEFSITALYGRCIAKVSAYDLARSGRSSWPIIRVFDNRVTQPDWMVMPDSGDPPWPKQYKALKECKVRNELISRTARLAQLKKLQTMIFVQHTAHGAALQQMIPGAEFVRGRTGSSKQNEAIRQGLKDGRIHTVICTSTWRQGVSIPGVDVLLQGSGYSDTWNREQELGRVLRKSSKGICFYADFADHGFSILRNHAVERTQELKALGFPVHSIREPEELFNVVGYSNQSTVTASYEHETTYPPGCGPK